MKEFTTANMDIRTLATTIIFGAICLGSILFLGNKFFETKEIGIIFPIIILILALLISYLMIPKIFVVNQGVVIKNTFTTIKIKKEDIRKIEFYPIVKFNFRTFGVGGIFGNFGYFNGNEVWYVTNIRKKIRIETYKKVYFISPENTEEFLRETRK